MDLAIVLLTIAFSLIQALAFFIINRLYKKVDMLEADMKGFRNNYLAQFSVVNGSLTEIKVSLARISERLEGFGERFNKMEGMLVKHDNSINAIKISHFQEHHKEI